MFKVTKDVYEFPFTGMIFINTEPETLDWNDFLFSSVRETEFK